MVTLVTGASGFIGRAICAAMIASGQPVRAAVRFPAGVLTLHQEGLNIVGVGDIGGSTNWSAALKNVDCVVHCAARAHVPRKPLADSLELYGRVNVSGTQRLAEQSAEFGVRRLIFLSTIGVLGPNTNGREPFVFSDEPAPVGNYAVSKLAAENALREVAASTDLEFVIVRPPLVYGSGARGSMARLLRLVRLRLPLPLGAVKNRRSFVGLDNLVDLLLRCIDHPGVAGHTLLVSDGEDISTPELIRRLARLMDGHARLVPVPVRLLLLAGKLAGRLGDVDRMVSSLRIDISHTRSLLDWQPALSVDEGLQRMVSFDEASRSGTSWSKR